MYSFSEVDQTHINQEAVKALVKANYSNLMVLNLGANRIREEGVKALVTAKYPDLHTLILSKLLFTQPRPVSPTLQSATLNKLAGLSSDN